MAMDGMQNRHPRQKEPQGQDCVWGGNRETRNYRSLLVNPQSFRHLTLIILL